MREIKLKDIPPGTIITYIDFCGGRRKVKVSNTDEDIKNGRPGFDGEVISGPEKGLGCWGYLDQIIHVTRE